MVQFHAKTIWWFWLYWVANLCTVHHWVRGGHFYVDQSAAVPLHLLPHTLRLMCPSLLNCWLPGAQLLYCQIKQFKSFFCLQVLVRRSNVRDLMLCFWLFPVAIECSLHLPIWVSLFSTSSAPAAAALSIDLKCPVSIVNACQKVFLLFNSYGGVFLASNLIFPSL